MSKIAYLNSRYIKFSNAKIHIEDRGLQFSDSVYEVVPFYNKKLIDFSFHVKDSGHQILAVKNQNIIRHVHREWEALGVNEREALSHKNFGHFLKKWRSRIDLLTKNN